MPHVFEAAGRFYVWVCESFGFVLSLWRLLMICFSLRESRCVIRIMALRTSAAAFDETAEYRFEKGIPCGLLN